MMFREGDHTDWNSGADSIALLADASVRLKRWLVDEAYPRWWMQGADRVHGGFHERLQQNGEPTSDVRRARLHPRQMYSFSLADDLGHDGLTDRAIRHGLDYFLRHYVRQDQFVRSVVAPDGTVVDDSILLYDQAFALLGYAAAFDVFNDEPLRERARELRAQLCRLMTNPAGGFRESPDRELPLTSNSHMHLLEAALAWMALDHDSGWRSLAEQLVRLAQSKFVDPRSSQIPEFFTSEWQPVEGEQGHIVEPGHQFEWAWLLLRWHAIVPDARSASLALSLIDTAERRGVDAERGVAMNSLMLNGHIRDGRARLWPQTERLKAACIAWETMRLRCYCDVACRAALTLEMYLQTPLSGLWRDIMSIEGDFIDEPAPASSFYHIVAAIAELDGLMNRSTATAVRGV